MKDVFESRNEDCQCCLYVCVSKFIYNYLCLMDAINNADCCGVVDVMSSYFLSGLIIKSSHFK